MTLQTWLGSFNRSRDFSSTDRMRIYIETAPSIEGYIASPYWPALTNEIRRFSQWSPAIKCWSFNGSSLRSILNIIEPFSKRVVGTARVAEEGVVSGSIDGVGVKSPRRTNQFSHTMHQLFDFPHGIPTGSFSCDLRPDIYLDECEGLNLNFGGTTTAIDGNVEVTLMNMNRAYVNRLSAMLRDRDFVSLYIDTPTPASPASSVSLPRMNRDGTYVEEEPDTQEPHVRRIRR